MEIRKSESSKKEQRRKKMVPGRAFPDDRRGQNRDGERTACARNRFQSRSQTLSPIRFVSHAPVAVEQKPENKKVSLRAVALSAGIGLGPMGDFFTGVRQDRNCVLA